MTGNPDPVGLERVAIAQLEPSLADSKRTVEGVVTLIWPYSVSNKSFSILLAEPDFRLRRQKGQVRIHFTGSSAKAVSQYDPQSGDLVTLSLVGAQWEKDEAVSRTPGRGIEWQLHFGERAALKIQRENQEPVHLSIDHPPPSPEPQNRSPPPSGTHPALDLQSTPIFSSTAPVRRQAWSTPAFLKRDRLSNTTFFGSDYDPFDDDEFRDNRRRKKTKFGRASDQWRFTETSPSPESIPHTETPVAGERAESEAQKAPSNGFEVVTAPQGSNQAAIDGHVVQAETFAASLDIPNHSEMVVDERSTRQTPTEANIGHDGSSIRTGSQGAEPSPVDEGVQTLRSGSEPRDQSYVLEETTAVEDVVVEEVLTPKAPYIDRVDQGNERANGIDTAGSPASRAEGVDGPGTPTEFQHEARCSLQPEGREADDSVPNEGAVPSNAPSEKSSSPVPVNVPASEPLDEAQMLDNSRPGLANYHEEQSIKSIPAAAMEASLDEQIPVSRLSPGDDVATVVSSKEIKEVQNSPSQIHEQSASELYQVELTNGQESVGPVSHAGPSQDQYIFATEGSIVFKAPLTDNTQESYAQVSRDRARRAKSESIPLASDSPPRRQSKEPSAPSLQDSPALRDEEIPESSRSRSISDSDEDEQEQIGHPDFFSEGEERQWDSEEADIIEEERQRYAGESKMRNEGWASQEEDYPSQDEPEAEEFSDEVQDAEVVETPETTQEPRSSLVEVINLDDSDEDCSPIARSQTDGAAMSILSDKRRRSLFAKASLSAKEANKPLRLSPPPLPDTVPDSQPVLDAAEPAPSTDAAVLQADDAASSSAHVPQPIAYQVPQEQQPVSDDEDPGEVQEMHTRSQPTSPTKDLPIEEHIDPRLKQRMLTPNDTQSQDEPFQASDVSWRSRNQSRDLPTPQLTQQRSFDNLLPATLRPSSPIAASSSPPLPEERTPSPLRNDEAPSLVDQLRRLKEEARRTPKQSPKSRRVSNIPASVSLWFAPRRSSVVVPDSRSQSDTESEDSEFASESEEQKAKDADVEEIPSSFLEPLAEQPTSDTNFQPTSTESPRRTSSPPATGFRTSHAFYAPLSTLSSHFNTQTSTLSVVLAATPITRANSGPRDFYTIIFVTDPSSLPSPVQGKPDDTPPITTVTIFRPTRSCLPSPLPSGSVLLLRSFTVSHTARAPSLLSTDSSAWAVFPLHADPTVSGPPVEYGAEERGYVRGLWGWWDQFPAPRKTSVVEQAEEKVRKAVQKAERERKNGRRLKGMGLRLAPEAEKATEKETHELRGGKEWRDDSVGVSPRGKKGKGKGEGKGDVRHELRDGKEWVDETGKRG
ncbi:MAG: hypothetical protein LQ338_007012 [Usnochroma carphineum]|nr:MAG: hypothetical protein LQ338_007012 [Usnochroma carphineum]